MALSLAVVAIAGVLLAVRTNFDPAIGPARLIFGFEAVIIGGLGSLWGTLAGGIMLGVAQAIGAQARSRLADSRRPSRVSRRARGAARRVCSRRCGDERAGPRRIADAPGSHQLAIVAVALVALAAAPWWGGRDDLRLLAEIYAYVALASLWNLLAGYAGLVSVGQQAYVGLGAYLLFALTILVGVPPLWRSRSPGVIAAVRVAAGGGADLPPARTLFRDRHLDRRRGVSPARLASLGARRRLRHQPAGRHRHLDRVEPADARVPDLLDRARAGGRGARRDRAASALTLRPGAARRSATTSSPRRATASMSRASSSSSTSSPRSAPRWWAR